jgi:hypothetical protein
VRKHYDALDRQTLDCGQQCKDTFDDLCAAVARCAEARGYDRGFLAGSIESVEERSRFGIERDALRETVREWALMRQDRDELLAENDALRETVARLTVADTDALTALILATAAPEPSDLLVCDEFSPLNKEWHSPLTYHVAQDTQTGAFTVTFGRSGYVQHRVRGFTRSRPAEGPTPFPIADIVSGGGYSDLSRRLRGAADAIDAALRRALPTDTPTRRGA